MTSSSMLRAWAINLEKRNEEEEEAKRNGVLAIMGQRSR